MKTNLLILYGEVIAICSVVHTKHVNAEWTESRMYYFDSVGTQKG